MPVASGPADAGGHAPAAPAPSPKSTAVRPVVGVDERGEALGADDQGGGGRADQHDGGDGVEGVHEPAAGAVHVEAAASMPELGGHP